MRSSTIGLALLLLCGMNPATVKAVAAYRCPAGGPGAGGPPDCTCVSWNASFEIRCPFVSDWRELGKVPNPKPPSNPNGGGGGAPGGNPPGMGIETNELLRTFLKDARNIALSRGKLSPIHPIKHSEYEPTECMELFAPYGPSMSNGKWIINQFIQFRRGEGVISNGHVLCNNAETSAWTLNAGSGYPYVFLCDRFKDLPLKEAAVILIHEALHVAGLQESPATPGKPTTHQIQDRVRQTCGL